jgi:nanoRNase/pAp phosphatase (c-di-AMP/oligoRNAs hydrolase)
MAGRIDAELQPVQASFTDCASELAALLEAHRGERHLIVLQDFPDPDAISSAYAHRLIAAAFDIEADVVYGGKISHQQNVALVKVLGINLIEFKASLDLAPYAAVVLLDTQGTNAPAVMSAVRSAELPVLMIVDHHELQEHPDAAFRDIRRTGATASIYAEYLEQELIRLDRGRKEHVLAATALMHGIITDTASLIRAQAEDLRAAAFLSHFRDADLLEHILSQARSKQTMEIIRRALGDRTVTHGFSIAGIGYLRPEDRDAIPQAADFLITEENVHTAIVYGIVGGTHDRPEAVHGSMRTIKITLDPDDFIKSVFGKDTSGRFLGGGKAGAGGFELPIGFLADGDWHRDNREEFRELKWQVFDTQIKQRIFAKIGVDKPPG